MNLEKNKYTNTTKLFIIFHKVKEVDICSSHLKKKKPSYFYDCWELALVM